MKRTEDALKYAAELGVSGGEALQRGMEAKSKVSSRRAASDKDIAQRKAEGQDFGCSRSQFVEKGTEVYAKA
jgi:hypothetical protein